MRTKAEFDVCIDYRRCFALGKSVIPKDVDKHCLGCEFYKAYLMGFNDGARQAVKAVNEYKPLLKEPLFKDFTRGGRE